MKAPLPHDEAQRLKTLHEYGVVDTAPEQSFDDLTLLAAHICRTPIAMVSLVDEKRQWFKSKIGISAQETSRDIAFCAHTILQKHEVTVVNDAQKDPRFADSALVTEDPHIRFYAGAPLIAPDGHALGALCVMDRAPHTLGTEQLAALRALSHQVVAQLELRRQARDLAKQATERQRTENLLRQQFEELSASKQNVDGLLATADKSRRVLLSLLEDQQRSSEYLRATEERFRQLAENINEVFWIITPEMDQIIYVSPAYETIWGRTCASLYRSPKDWVLAIHPDDRKNVLEADVTKIKRGGFNEIYRIVRPNGSIRWIQDRGFPVRDADGEVYRIVGVAEDITESKAAEEELRWKTAFLEAQVQAALDGLLVVNSQGRKILQNQRMNDLWKIPQQIAEDPDDASQVEYVTTQTKNPGQFAKKVAYLYAHPNLISRDEIELIDGRVFDRYSAPVQDKGGKYYGRIWTFRDITDQRKLEVQLRHSQKMEGIGQLAGGVAHDFNNILAIIQMQSELIKGRGSLTAEQAEFADEIGTTVQRAAALTRQLLLFSRREVFQPREMDLSESTKHTAKMLKRTLPENIQIQLKLAAKPAYVLADGGMMDQVLLNLAVNARDAMPGGGLLVIETAGVDFDELAAAQSTQARPGSFVCLSVSDTGCGIAPEIRTKVFEPFFTTKDVGKGTGLGLATVFGIVEQHRGWINLYSELGQGTTFRIYLPRLANKSDGKTAPPSMTEMHGGRETILLVEDDPTLCLSVRNVLARLGYRIFEAPSAAAALEIWKQNHDQIDLVLTDLVMPGRMNGKELIKRLHQENPGLKEIFMSGYSAEVIGKDFPLKEGVNFLAKPFQVLRLAQTIRSRLDN